MKKVWMWPKTDINSGTVTDTKSILIGIEQYFSDLYAPYKVVYFSRARVGLMAISVIRDLSRAQLTFVQPFSSHCVLSAIAYQSTPSTIFPHQSAQQVIYHQWGSKTEVNKQVYTNVLVEDAVDSLILTNEKSELFPNNAPFCLISLPKVCQVSVGALVVCQHDDDYHKLVQQRTIMEQELGSIMEHLNMPCFQESTLQVKPTLVPKLEKGIDVQIENSINQIKSNLATISQLFPQLALNVEDTPKRLVSNVAILQSKFLQEELYALAPFTVIEQQRSYFNYDQQCCEKVWLLPCHLQANWC